MPTNPALEDPVPTQAPMNPFALISADAQRKRAIADLLLRQGMQGAPQGEMVSGHYIKPSLFSQLGPVASAFLSQRLASKSTQEQLNLAQQYTGARQSQVEKFLQDYQTNPRSAIIRAMANPMLADIAGPLLSKTLPTPENVASLGKDFTAESISKYGASGNPADLVRIQSAQPGNVQTLGEGANAKVAVPAQTPVYAPPIPLANGAVIQGRTDTGKYESVSHPTMSVNTQVSNMPENKLVSAAGEAAIKDLSEGRNSALKAQQAFSQLQAARGMLTSGIWTNYGAEAIPHVKSMLGALGYPISKDDESKLYNAQAAQQVLLNATMKAALESESARGMNTKAEQAALQASAADQNAALPSRLGALDAAIGGLANIVNQHHSRVLSQTTIPNGLNPALADQVQLPYQLMRQQFDVAPMQLPGDRYDVDKQSGLYTLKPNLLPQATGAAPGAASQMSPQEFLKSLPAGSKYIGPVPNAAASPAVPPGAQ